MKKMYLYRIGEVFNYIDEIEEYKEETRQIAFRTIFKKKKVHHFYTTLQHPHCGHFSRSDEEIENAKWERLPILERHNLIHIRELSKDFKVVFLNEDQVANIVFCDLL